MRVWWNPQVGANATFYVPVDSVEQAKRVMDILSAYDCFQWNHHIKPDYCNCGGLQVYDQETGEWEDWYYESEDEYYDDVDEYCEMKSDQKESLKDFFDEVFAQVTFDEKEVNGGHW